MEINTTEIPIRGMDCAECTRHVKHAIEQVGGVESVEVYLASEKAVIQYQPGHLDEAAIRAAVASAGYSVPSPDSPPVSNQTPPDYTRSILSLLGILFGVILLIIVVGEWLGLFERISAQIPWPVSLAIVILIGYPAFLNVIRATRNRQIIAHSLMSLGVLAAIAVGEWATAAVVAFFMRVGDYVERFTTDRARQAVKDLSTLAPQTARLIQDGSEFEVPIEQVRPGEIVVVRPGEQIPVDGEVIAGHAILDQATITGESMPIEAGPGTHVFAATLASQGSLRVRATQVGSESTYGKVIQLVEEAEAQRGDIQRLADKFSAYYLPVVIGVAALTLIIRRDPMATAAVLVVACSCAFALATPIAILASVGAAAKRGILIKGGKYLEIIPKIDLLLIDKTGTLTLGKPFLTDIIPLGIQSEGESIPTSLIESTQSRLITLAASAERYSEHPLAEAVRHEAAQRGIMLIEPDQFETIPGMGIKAQLNGDRVVVGNRRLIEDQCGQAFDSIEEERLLAEGKSLLYLAANDQPCGILAAADQLRPEVPRAIESIRQLGVKQIELLTGDNQANASRLAEKLDVSYQADLLPEDKIDIVKKYQAKDHTVLMVGDGINDAPALAQADIGIAMGAAGHNIAMEAADIVLMRPDWMLIPQVLKIGQRTTRTIKGNIFFTLVYNFIGLSLAALGFLPPILAAAAQSIPDLAILANSSRLLRQK
ncbi:MAG: heavy metal translocating P-type ATPase [Anaerolineales bacterium]|jgi:Cd2+/Zn2+-exporting ATPase/Cu+-exporting ATPase